MNDHFESNDIQNFDDSNHFPQIDCLEDSQLLTHRRSKSLGINRNENKKRFLLKKKETENEGESKLFKKESYNLSEFQMESNKKIAFENLEKRQTINTLNSTNSLNYSKTDFEKQTKNEINTQFKTEESEPTKKFSRELKLHDQLMSLKEKYRKLKENSEISIKREENWRKNYFCLLENSIQFEETIKNLIEENRIHQEYIISLENKLNKVLKNCSLITENFHNSLTTSW